jgi:hypothetical protein
MKHRVNKPSFRRALVLAVITVLAVLPASAFGAQPISDHYRLVGEHEGLNQCGLTVDEVFKGVFTNTVFLDNEGNFVRAQQTASGTSIFTAANGKSVTVHFAQRSSNPPFIIDEQARTLTFVFTITGMPSQLRATHGGVLTQDVGLLTFAQTFDLETGTFISGEIVALNGPHDDLESGFTAFCEAFTQALA